MENYKEIIVEWEYTSRWDLLESSKKNKTGVLYQIYCDSHIYGRGVLAYIGMTKNTFNERFKEHLNSYFKFANNRSFAIGTIENLDGLKLETIESILIANHKPFFNKNHLHSVKDVKVDPDYDESINNRIIVINNGEHGSLKNSCTNFWWLG